MSEPDCRVRAPRCPGCDQEPIFAFERQAFCGTVGCLVVSWDRFDDPAQFKAKATVLDLDLSPPAGPATFTCPVCGATSAHPTDVEEGYCGRCRDWQRR